MVAASTFLRPTMLGRLRLLRRISTLEISPSITLPPLSIFRDLSILSPSTRRQRRGQGTKSLFSLHPKKSRGFCAREAEAEDAQPFWPHYSVRIRCNEDVADTLSESLLCFGASSVSMDEISNSQDPNETWITSLFADDQDVHTCISLAADSIGLKDTPDYEVSKGEQCDWLMNMQEMFHPIEITSGLWIVPKWRTPPVQKATNIFLNPGMAFGTGEHPTTKLCLHLLHSLISGGEQFLDYGTGSGVLGIAALKMGAKLSVGIDVDPQAVTSARQNFALNDIETYKMRVYLVSGSVNSNSEELSAQKEKFDIVIANILLNPLLNLADDIASYAKPGAVIGLSGIISEQIQQIKEQYSVHLDNISVTEMDGWACVHGNKRK